MIISGTLYRKKFLLNFVKLKVWWRKLENNSSKCKFLYAIQLGVGLLVRCQRKTQKIYAYLILLGRSNCSGFSVLFFNNIRTILRLCQKCTNVLILPCPCYPLILHFHSHGAYNVIALKVYFAFPCYVWIDIFIFSIYTSLFLCIFIFAIICENESVSSSVMSDSVMKSHGL